MLSIGDVIGSYRVEKVVTGGMGFVYVCSGLPVPSLTADIDTDGATSTQTFVEPGPEYRLVAIKTSDANYLWSEENASAFQREALIPSLIPPHPYIIKFLHLMRGETIGIVLEYAEGGSLRERIASKKLDLVSIITVLRKICVGLEFLASFDIHHRDLKPENILFTKDGDVRIADFGLATLQSKRLSHLSDVGTVKTDPGVQRFVGGTLPYMSPEHFAIGEFTVASDVYSLGIIMFEMLMGRRPFEGSSAEEFRLAHLSQAPPRVNWPSRDAQRLSSVIYQCLRKAPDERFSDFGTLDAELAEIALAKGKTVVSAPQRPSVTDLENAMTSGDWTNRGASFGILGRNEESLRCHERALELDPESPLIRCNLAAALSRMGKTEESLALAQEGVTRFPRFVVFRAQLAILYAQNSRWLESAEQFEAAVNLDPNNLAYRRLLAMAYKRLGKDADFERMIDEMISILANGPHSLSSAQWTNDGIMFGRDGEFATSLRFLNECVQRIPDSSDGWYNRAVTLFFMSDFAAAHDSAERALELRPSAPQVLFFLGFMALMVPETYAKDSYYFGRLVALHPNHQFARAAEIAMSGMFLAREGETAYREVREFLARLLKPLNMLYFRG